MPKGEGSGRTFRLRNDLRAFLKQDVRSIGEEPHELLAPRCDDIGQTKPLFADKERLFLPHGPAKAEIIRRGLELGVDYGSTSTCYDPDVEGRACGRCDACTLRLRAFAELGLRDPAPYQGAGS